MNPHAPVRRHASWLLLIAAALLVRALVPQGMMVQESASGWIEIVPCDFAEMRMPAHGDGADQADHGGSAHDNGGHENHGPENDGHEQNQPCLFAGHSAAAAPPADPPLPHPPVTHASAFATAAVARVSTTPARTLPPARAPPRSA